MTTFYRPVTIETAHLVDGKSLPMEKFPEGTIATHPDYWPVERCDCSRWESEGDDRYDPEMVGWTALIPIEVEEETRVAEFHMGTFTDGGVEFDDRTGEPTKHEHRYLTAWEETR